MKYGTKLVLWLGGLSTAGFLMALAIGYGWSSSSERGIGTVVSAAAITFALLMLWGFAGWVSQRQTERIRSLLAQVKESAVPGAVRRIRVSGNDEIAELAERLNRIAAERNSEEESRSRMVSDAAHELRTPVAILRGHLETMLRGASELKPENLVSLLDETKRMSRLIRELQQISLAESGKLKLDRSWTAMSRLIGEVADIFVVDADEKNVQLVCELAEDDEVYCDASRMKQVLINLIGNAIRYTPEGGSVEIRQFRPEDGSVRVEVSDTGPGIPPEKLPYIFHRFYRVDEGRSRSDGGIGLGLAIARQFVEAHDGTLEVTSAAGQGSRFTILLPVFPDA